MSEIKKKIRQQFRNICFVRDNYTCKMCKKISSPEKINEEMDCHHISSKNSMPNGGYVKENGITLCKDNCHIKAEEFHSTGIAPTGFTINDLYVAINSSLDKAKEESLKLCK